MTFNIFTIIILFALFGDFILNLFANLLNLKSIQQPLPFILQGIFNPDDYTKSQRYLRANTRSNMLESIFNLAVLLVFWAFGGFSWLYGVLVAWSFPPIYSGLLYIGMIFLAHTLLTLPFRVYDTFVIEEKFGFNHTTPSVFIQDILKQLIIGVVLGGFLLSAVLALFLYGGATAWIYCWAALIVFSLITQYIAPTWIMPLFNKFKTLESGELKDAILKYTASVNFPVNNIYVMDGSRRSSKSNAFFTGFGANKRIALYDTLIAQHTTAELVAILAHEVGHYKRQHILQSMIIGVLQTGIILFLLSLLVNNPELYRAFNINGQPIYAGLLFFGLLYAPMELIISILVQIMSRKHEYEADMFAVTTLNTRDSMISALKKLAATNLSNLTPHPLYVFINYSHPPLKQRLEVLQKTNLG